MPTPITFQIVGEGRDLETKLTAVERQLGRVGKAGADAGKQGATGLTSLQRAAQSSDSTLKRLADTAVHVRSALATVFGVSLGVAALRSLQQLADGYTNISSKIRTVTESEIELNRVREKTFAISQRTRTEWESTVTLYSRLTRATKNLSTTENERLAITQTINKAYSLSGATIQEATNSIIQLTQGLASGVLRGEEFNSVAEQGPIILDILSKSLNKTRGELRAIAHDGQLTGEVVVKALLENGSVIDAEFAKVAVTIEGAAVRVSNAWQKWVGEATTASGASRGIAQVFTSLANNMGEVADALLVLGETFVLVYGGRTLSGLVNFLNEKRKLVISTMENVAASRAELEANVAVANSQVEQSALRVQEVTQRHANIVAIREEIAAEAQLQLAKVRSAQTNLAAAIESGAARNIQQSATGKLVYAETALARQQEQLIVLTKAEVAARKELVVAQTTQTGSTSKLITAQGELAVASSRLGVVWSSIKSVGAGLFAALGGWVTVAVAAGYALYSWMTDVQDNTQLIEAFDGRIRQLKESSLELADVWRAALQGGEARKQNLVELAESQLKLAQQEQDNIKANYDYNLSWQTLTATLGTSVATAGLYEIKMAIAQDRMDEVKQKIQELKDAELEATLAGWANKALQVGQEWAKMLGIMENTPEARNTKQDNANTSTLATELSNLRERNIELTKGVVAAKEYSLLQKLGVKDIQELLPAQQAQVAETLKLVAANEAASKAKKDYAKNEKIDDKEDQRIARSIEAQRQFTLQTLALAAALEGPLASATAEYNATFEDLMAQFENADINAQQMADRWAVVKAQFEVTSASIKKNEKDIVGLAAATAKYEQSLVRMTPKQRAVAQAVHESQIYFRQNEEVLKKAGKTLESYAEDARDVAEATYDVNLKLENINNILEKFAEKSPFAQTLSDIKDMREEAAGLVDEFGHVTNPQRFEELGNAIRREIGSALQQAGAMSTEALRSIQSMTKEGSRSYEALGLAIQATTLLEAIGAIVHQGTSGDVYTAIPRMIAMAAMVAQLVKGVKSFGAGGFSDTAAQRQETQGTGSVLGDAKEKSESSAKSLEITADATSKLVAINRGMLRALLDLKAGLGSAANMLARGAGTADFSGQNLAVGQASALNGILGNVIDPLGAFGASSKITDEGIIIFGGALTDMLNDIAVGAYQEVQSRSWAFGSTHTNEGFSAVSDEFATQFQLIVGSIVDTVREGALALGLLPADIQAALDAFAVEEIRISLKDLTAEEAQAELVAVFSQMFDGLAGAVVPFIEQFQQIGEGLGETLVRVATEVQVFQQAIRYLGLSVNETDPEKFAQIADGLVQAAGGIDNFITQMTSFANNFAPEAYQFQTASQTLIDAFAQAGLVVPKTKDAMWDLLRSLDATTESGREQISTILRLGDVAEQYYNMLDQRVKDATKTLEELGISFSNLSAFGQKLEKIRASSLDAISAANAIAIAQGRQGASGIQLARITQWTTSQYIQAMKQLQQETQDILAELQGGIPGSLDAINQQIADLEGSAGTIEDLTEASNNLFESWASGLESLQNYLDNMLFGDLSALTPEQQQAEAMQQFMEAQQAALGGDQTALANLPQLAEQYLQILRNNEASGDDYNSQFFWVRDLLQQVMDAGNPYTATGDAAPIQVTASPELQALYQARDALLLEQENQHRAELSLQLAQNLHDMAILLNTPILEMITLQGTSLRELSDNLGIDLENLTTASVSTLGQLASILGINLTQLTDGLGITLTDLSAGLTDLAERLGIDLSNLTVGSTQSLAVLATTLGGSLSELATSLSLDLGSLTDAQSLMNQALAAEINTLPEEQATALSALLNNITEATSESDANVAISALEDAVNLLAPDIRTQLAPYLANVFPADALQDLDYLESIRDIAYDQLDVMGLINQNLRARNSADGVQSYAVGTGYVPQTGLANIHQGEAIIPAPFATWLRNEGFPVANPSNNSAVVVELQNIRNKLDSMERSNSAGHEKIVATVDSGDQQARNQRDDIDRRTQNTSRSRS